MPPEYIREGIISIKNDIYSLGVIIIKMTAGQLGVSRLHAMAPKEFIDHVSKLYAFVTFVLHAAPIYFLLSAEISQVIENIKLPEASRSALPYEIAISQVKKCVEIAFKMYLC